MGKRDEQRKIKVCVLSRIKEKINVLFGQFSSILTKEMKTKAWQEICNYAKAIGAVRQDKDYKYLRDVWFNNARKSTMEKVDNAKKTGAGGEENSKTTEVDDFILDIIGKENPVVEGLGVLDSLEENEVDINNTSREITSIQQDEDPDEVEPVPPHSHKSVKKKGGLKTNADQEEIDPLTILKKKNMELVIENLEKESYLKTLQILKLERELQMQPSRFTAHLAETEETCYILPNESEQH